MVYHIDYTDSQGYNHHVWCDAKSPEEATSRVKNECWNVDTIIQVYKKSKSNETD